MPLSERQTAAAHRMGQDVCVVAGPGSGKTSVLIERFSWLVQSRGVAPNRILAITFTEKAATEIRERLVKQFADAPHLREQIERAWVSTIHAFCARLLRENAIEAGIDPQVVVLERAMPVLRQAADDVLEGMYATERERMQRFLRSLAVATERDGYVPDLATSLIEIHDALRLAGSGPEALDDAAADLSSWARLKEIASEIACEHVATRTPTQADQHAEAQAWACDVLALPDAIGDDHLTLLNRRDLKIPSLVKGSKACEHEKEIRTLCDQLTREALTEYYVEERRTVREALTRIGELYRERKRAMSALDFDDLEEGAIHLLSHNEDLRQRVASGFDFILMDELQDTNPLQWKLMELVRRPGNFFAVGDVNQSIYGFRHARPELFSAYRAGLEGAGLAVDELRDNYRTRPQLLDVVNRVFGGAAGIETHTLTAGREFAEKHRPSAEVLVMTGEEGPATERLEALAVANRISEVVNELGFRYADIAVLTRANYSTGELQRALDAFGIPSVVLGGQTFYETREVRDLKLALDVMLNPRDEIALAGLLRSPLFGVSDERLLRYAAGREFAKAVDADPPEGWVAFLELRRFRNAIGPDRLLRRLIDDRDYESDLAGRARANIEKFLAMLRDRYERKPQPLAAIVADIEDAAPDSEAPPPDFGDTVRLMTLHKAKGLEFPVVFLPYLHKGRSTGFPIVSWSEEHGLGIKWRNPATNLGEGDAAWRKNRDAARSSQDAEENRLLYVGMTRAKEHLVLSWSRTGNERGAWPGLVTGALGISPEAVTNEPVEQHGLRVLVTDRAPAARPDEARARIREDTSHVARITSPMCADASAPVTDISRFLDCPRKYYLARYLRWPSVNNDESEAAPAPAVAATEVGRQVHELLAGQSVPDASAEAIDLADRFLTSELGKRSTRARERHREWDFVFEEGGLIVRGQIDLWFQSGREVTIVDYKTDRAIVPSAVEAHSLQVQIYALALERWLGRLPDRGVLCFLRPGVQVEVDLTPLSLGAARDLIYRFRTAQERGEWPLRTGEHCRRCEFFHNICPATQSQAV